MPVLDIYKQNIKTIYKTTVLTKTTFYVVLTIFITLIFPLIFAYRSRGFWLKHDTFYEQPNIKYTGQYLLVGLTNNASNIIVCNNIHKFNQFHSFDVCSTVKVREIDLNLDSKIDLLDFKIEIDLPEKEKLKYFTILLTLDYNLQTVCPLKMQSGIIFQNNQVEGTTGLDVTANLKLVQKNPLLCHHKRKDTLYNYPLINNLYESKSYKIENILNDYLQRNFSTHLNEIYTTFTSGMDGKFNINLKISYPEHKVYYRPGFWQIMKWAWIQYFTIYVIFSWIIRKINNYIFDHHLLLFYKVCPIQKKK